MAATLESAAADPFGGPVPSSSRRVHLQSHKLPAEDVTGFQTPFIPQLAQQFIEAGTRCVAWIHAPGPTLNSQRLGAAETTSAAEPGGAEGGVRLRTETLRFRSEGSGPLLLNHLLVVPWGASIFNGSIVGQTTPSPRECCLEGWASNALVPAIAPLSDGGQLAEALLAAGEMHPLQLSNGSVPDSVVLVPRLRPVTSESEKKNFTDFPSLLWTDTIVLRGVFERLTVCVFGTQLSDYFLTLLKASDTLWHIKQEKESPPDSELALVVAHKRETADGYVDDSQKTQYDGLRKEVKQDSMAFLQAALTKPLKQSPDRRRSLLKRQREDGLPVGSDVSKYTEAVRACRQILTSNAPAGDHYQLSSAFSSGYDLIRQLDERQWSCMEFDAVVNDMREILRWTILPAFGLSFAPDTGGALLSAEQSSTRTGGDGKEDVSMPPTTRVVKLFDYDPDVPTNGPTNNEEKEKGGTSKTSSSNVSPPTLREPTEFEEDSSYWTVSPEVKAGMLEVLIRYCSSAERAELMVGGDKGGPGYVLGVLVRSLRSNVTIFRQLKVNVLRLLSQLLSQGASRWITKGQLLAGSLEAQLLELFDATKSTSDEPAETSNNLQPQAPQTTRFSLSDVPQHWHFETQTGVVALALLCRVLARVGELANLLKQLTEFADLQKVPRSLLANCARASSQLLHNLSRLTARPQERHSRTSPVLDESLPFVLAGRYLQPLEREHQQLFTASIRRTALPLAVAALMESFELSKLLSQFSRLEDSSQDAVWIAARTGCTCLAKFLLASVWKGSQLFSDEDLLTLTLTSPLTTNPSFSSLPIYHWLLLFRDLTNDDETSDEQQQKDHVLYHVLRLATFASCFANARKAMAVAFVDYSPFGALYLRALKSALQSKDAERLMYYFATFGALLRDKDASTRQRIWHYLSANPDVRKATFCSALSPMQLRVASHLPLELPGTLEDDRRLVCAAFSLLTNLEYGDYFMEGLKRVSVLASLPALTTDIPATMNKCMGLVDNLVLAQEAVDRAEIMGGFEPPSKYVIAPGTVESHSDSDLSLNSVVFLLLSGLEWAAERRQVALMASEQKLIASFSSDFSVLDKLTSWIDSRASATLCGISLRALLKAAAALCRNEKETAAKVESAPAITDNDTSDAIASLACLCMRTLASILIAPAPEDDSFGGAPMGGTEAAYFQYSLMNTESKRLVLDPAFFKVLLTLGDALCRLHGMGKYNLHTEKIAAELRNTFSLWYDRGDPPTQRWLTKELLYNARGVPSLEALRLEILSLWGPSVFAPLATSASSKFHSTMQNVTISDLSFSVVKSSTAPSLLPLHLASFHLAALETTLDSTSVTISSPAPVTRPFISEDTEVLDNSGTEDKATVSRHSFSGLAESLNVYFCCHIPGANFSATNDRHIPLITDLNEIIAAPVLPTAPDAGSTVTCWDTIYERLTRKVRDNVSFVQWQTIQSTTLDFNALADFMVNLTLLVTDSNSLRHLIGLYSVVQGVLSAGLPLLLLLYERVEMLLLTVLCPAAAQGNIEAVEWSLARILRAFRFVASVCEMPHINWEAVDTLWMGKYMRILSKFSSKLKESREQSAQWTSSMLVLRMHSLCSVLSAHVAIVNLTRRIRRANDLFVILSETRHVVGPVCVEVNEILRVLKNPSDLIMDTPQRDTEKETWLAGLDMLRSINALSSCQFIRNYGGILPVETVHVPLSRA